MAAPAAGASRRQIDRLGERLRAGVTPEDRLLLDGYQESFFGTLLAVNFDLGRMGIGESDGGRLKRPESIIAKLERDSRIRLSRMQDIAGCRLLAANKAEQDEIYARLQTDFDIYRAYDIRETPHSGYRAVHIVVRRGDRFVEVQVRTERQREWARLSEDATALDPAIKYGGGDSAIRQALDELSAAYWAYDQAGETPPADLARTVRELIGGMGQRGGV